MNWKATLGLISKKITVNYKLKPLLHRIGNDIDFKDNLIMIFAKKKSEIEAIKYVDIK